MHEDENSSKKELYKKLQQEINNLPEKRKEIFILHKIEGYKYIEIAEHLDISVKTVKNQLLKAYNKIRETLS